MGASKALKEIMAKRGLQVSATANNLGIPVQTFRNKLCRDTMSYETVEKYADKLGCDVRLIDRTDGIVFDCVDEQGRQGVVIYRNPGSLESELSQFESSERGGTAGLDLRQENLRLRKELEEAKNENKYLRNVVAFFAKESN